jgi:hypothetical protein
MPHTLKADGDQIEQQLYAPLIQPHFPSYEVFWDKFVIPLTNRPVDIQLKTDADLATIGKGDHDICIAQLHYSVLRHLGRAYVLRQNENYSLDHLVCSLSSIVGAQDVAFELLQRFKHPSNYGAWLETRTGGVDGGREARKHWKRADGHPLQDIRNYRNHLIHGRTPPGIDNKYPKIGRENSYFDWRKITAAAAPPVADFDSATDIHDAAFSQTVTYFETKWAAELLPNI